LAVAWIRSIRYCDMDGCAKPPAPSDLQLPQSLKRAVTGFGGQDAEPRQTCQVLPIGLVMCRLSRWHHDIAGTSTRFGAAA
jgi:hypothetical protein